MEEAVRRAVRVVEVLDQLVRAPGSADIEASDARLRAECLNASWFLSRADARARIEEWRCHSSEERPHAAPSNFPPPARSSDLLTMSR